MRHSAETDRIGMCGPRVLRVIFPRKSLKELAVLAHHSNDYGTHPDGLRRALGGKYIEEGHGLTPNNLFDWLRGGDRALVLWQQTDEMGTEGHYSLVERVDLAERIIVLREPEKMIEMRLLKFLPRWWDTDYRGWLYERWAMRIRR